MVAVDRSMHLDSFQKFHRRGRDVTLGHRRFLPSVSPDHDRLLALQVTRANLQADGNTLLLPVVEPVRAKPAKNSNRSLGVDFGQEIIEI